MADSLESHHSNDSVRNITSEFIAANTRWARRMNQAYPRYFPRASGQAPKILWIGCSDSRVQESDLLEALPGDVFVHRNIANQVHENDDNVLSVLEYAIHPKPNGLGIQHIVIVGHSECGGVIHAREKAREPKPQDGPQEVIEQQHRDYHEDYDINGLVSKSGLVIDRWLRGLIERLRGPPVPPVPEAIRANVVLQVQKFNPGTTLNRFVKAAAGNDRPVWVHGWVYDLRHGFVRDLNVTVLVE